MELHVKKAKKKLAKIEHKKPVKTTKIKKPVISTRYADETELHTIGIQVGFNRITYGCIKSCEAERISLPEGIINLTGSWDEIILTMLSALLSYDNAQEIMVDNGLCSDYFIVDSKYGKLTSNIRYKTYKIPGTNLFLEMSNDYKTVYKAIRDLIKCLGYEEKDIMIDIYNPKTREISKTIVLLDQNEKLVNIDELKDYLKKKWYLSGVVVNNQFYDCSELKVALVIVLKTFVFKYADVSKYNTKKIGVCDIGDSELPTARLNENQEVYDAGDTTEEITYIKKLASKYNEVVKFKLKTIQKFVPKHEWETD